MVMMGIHFFGCYRGDVHRSAVAVFFFFVVVVFVFVVVVRK